MATGDINKGNAGQGKAEKPLFREELWDKAYDAMYRNDHGRALKLFRRYVVRFPKSDQVRAAKKYINSILQDMYTEESLDAAEKKYWKATELLEDGNISKALSQYKLIVKKYPGSRESKDAAFQINRIERKMGIISADGSVEDSSSHDPHSVSGFGKSVAVSVIVIALISAVLWAGNIAYRGFVHYTDQGMTAWLGPEDTRGDRVDQTPEPIREAPEKIEPLPVKVKSTANNKTEQPEKILVPSKVTPKVLKKSEQVESIPERKSRTYKVRDGSMTVHETDEIEYDIPLAKSGNRNAVALVIGIRNYSKTSQVNFALNDARLIRHYLLNTLGYREGNVIMLEDATQSDLALYLGNKSNYKGKLFNMVKPGKSDVFIYYAGHGAPGLKSKKGYFVPVGADPNYIELSGYSLDDFYTNISKLPARSVTVILDACFSGAKVYRNISPIVTEIVRPELKINNGVIISSSRGSQASSWYNDKEHGMFTYFFLKGIHSRNADRNRDKILTFDEIFSYVSDKTEGVPYYARRINGVEQNPSIQGKFKNRVFVRYK